MLEAGLFFDRVDANFPDIRFWLDQAVDYPDKFRVEDIMIKQLGNPPSWRSFESESKALGALTEVNQVRVYADVRGDLARENEVLLFCRDFMK